MLQQGPLQAGARCLQWLDVFARGFHLRQAQAQALAQELLGRCHQETAQCVQRQLGVGFAGRSERNRCIHPRRELGARAGQAASGGMPAMARQ